MITEVPNFRSRKENLENARAHAASGNTAAAYECYQRAVDISPAVAKQFIEVRQTVIVCPGHTSKNDSRQLTPP